MHEVEAAGLVRRVAVCVVGEPGDGRLEPVQRPMEEPVHHGFDSEPTLGFFFHHLKERGENVRKETMRTGHVGCEAEDHISRISLQLGE